METPHFAGSEVGTPPAHEKKPDPVGDSQGGFFDPLSPVSALLTAPGSDAEASEDLSPENTGLLFEEVNEVTLKLTDGGGSNIPSSHAKWGGYRVARALWIINIGPPQVMACPLRRPIGGTDHIRQSQEGGARDGHRSWHWQATT